MSHLISALLYIVPALVMLGMGSPIQININPHTFRGIESSSVNITCTTDNAANDIQEVVLMQISKDGGKPMVLIRKDSQISHGTGAAAGNHFQAEGTITTDTTKNYIRVTFPHPVSSDSGLYTCSLYYLDKTGILNENKASGSLIVQGLNQIIDQLISNTSRLDGVVDRVTQLEKSCCSNSPFRLQTQSQTSASLADRVVRIEKRVENISHSNSDDSQCTGLSNKISECLNRISAMEQTTKNTTDAIQKKMGDDDSVVLSMVKNLEELNRKQSQEINTLIAQGTAASKELATLKEKQRNQTQELNSLNLKLKQLASPQTSAFSASTNRTDITINKSGDVIPFSDLITSQGQGYDATTGIFKAPYEGIYAFHLVIAMDARCQGCGLEVHMVKNRWQVLATLNVIGSSSYTDRFDSASPQSGVSIVVHLNAGDEVSNMVAKIYRSAHLDPHSVHSSVFTGYLLQTQA